MHSPDILRIHEVCGWAYNKKRATGGVNAAANRQMCRCNCCVDQDEDDFMHGRRRANALDACASTNFSKKKIIVYKIWYMALCIVTSVTWISERLTSNGRIKCRSLRTIIPPSIRPNTRYDRDPSHVLDLLTVWPLWLYDRDLIILRHYNLCVQVFGVWGSP